MQEIDKLVPRRQLFVREYMRDLNAAATARRIGLTPATAVVLMGDAQVRRAIDEQMRIRARRMDISADSVLTEIAYLADGNVKRFFDSDGRLIPIHKLDYKTAGTITEFTEKVVSKGEQAGEVVIERKYKMADRGKYLDLLAKHLRLYEPEKGSGGNVEVHVKVNLIEPPTANQEPLEGEFTDG